ncbi:endonuclease [candidate division bacterium WOR-3 4484_18]|uniref:Endonuclease n=1 Tax=candidate division WOR-3 bacterium 4484_18 TaxID=2020626 RepID=A0A257LV53_UNCW3|nr:MAG: endonuclease [candidate division bacterium WOR-3 4484_18]
MCYFIVMKGCYVLLVELPRDIRITVGKLGKLTFTRGYYAYVGSAMNNIEVRVKRHISSHKRKRWHIDYLLEHGRIVAIYYRESKYRCECELADGLRSKFEPIHKFGATDCRCGGHLFYNRNLYELVQLIEEMGLKQYTG